MFLSKIKFDIQTKFWKHFCPHNMLTQNTCWWCTFGQNRFSDLDDRGYRHTERQTFLKTIFLSPGYPKTYISTDNSKSLFCRITTLSLYYSIWEKVRIQQPAWDRTESAVPHSRDSTASWMFLAPFTGYAYTVRYCKQRPQKFTIYD